MSEPTAIGAVTAVLQNLLREGLHGFMDQQYEVFARAPSRMTPDGANEPAGIDLFLFQVSPNSAWRNRDLPARDGDGERLGAPALVLDLHYLLAAYGQPDLLPDLLLGRAMQLLHETSIVGRDKVRALLKPPAPDDPNPGFKQYLAQSGIADQFEQLRISLEPTTIDDMNKLWTACQAGARPAAAYKVTTVIIQSRRASAAALPVRVPAGIVVQTLDRPRIDAVMAATVGGPIVAGSKLAVTGAGLAAPGLRVLMNEVDLSGAVQAGRTDARLVVQLPSPLGTDHRAGVATLRAEVPAPAGLPAWAAKQSNLAAFVLQPKATFATSGTSATTENGTTFVTGSLDLEIDPFVRRDQQLRVLLNETPAPADRTARTFSFSWVPPASPTPVKNVSVLFARLPPGTYLARVSVDGAESPLAFDGTAYSGPTVTL